MAACHLWQVVQMNRTPREVWAQCQLYAYNDYTSRMRCFIFANRKSDSELMVYLCYLNKIKKDAFFTFIMTMFHITIHILHSSCVKCYYVGIPKKVLGG